MIFIFIVLLILLIIDFLSQSYIFWVKYALNPLDITTFDGSNQPYHPTVVYKEKGWNGFRYWMALTPYPMNKPPYKDRWECPCIYCSDDGIHWKVPKGIENPLDDLTSEEILHKDFFSDPHLVLKGNVLECWYRISHHTNGIRDTYVIMKSSLDGIHWSERNLMIDPTTEESLDSVGDMVRSPAILYTSYYEMWYVDNKENIGQRNVCYTTSSNGKNWNKRSYCKLVGKEINPWHIDVSFIDHTYYLLVYDLYDLTLWKSEDGLTFSYQRTLLQPTLKFGSFYSDGLYRSVLVKTEDEFLCYFSAFDEKRTSIGLMAGKDLEHLEVVNSRNEKRLIADFITIYMQNRKRTLSRIKQRLLNFIS